MKTMKTVGFNFSEQKDIFDSSMLRTGELMEVTERNFRGHTLLRTYDNIVSLTDPNHTWDIFVELQGRKLLPDEGITLIQE